MTDKLPDDVLAEIERLSATVNVETAELGCDMEISQMLSEFALLAYRAGERDAARKCPIYMSRRLPLDDLSINEPEPII